MHGFGLRRWSRRKLASARKPIPPAPLTPDVAPSAAPGALPMTSAVAAYAAPAALPPVETLTFESDFTAFLRPDVDDGVRCAALRKLLRDPRFNVMDGLDVYIDDYSQPSPMPPALARALVDTRRMFDGGGECESERAASVPPERAAEAERDPPATTATPGERDA